MSRRWGWPRSDRVHDRLTEHLEQQHGFWRFARRRPTPEEVDVETLWRWHVAEHADGAPGPADGHRHRTGGFR